MNMKEHTKYLREGYWSHTRLQKTTNVILNCVGVLPFLCPSWRRLLELHPSQALLQIPAQKKLMLLKGYYDITKEW